MRARFSILRPRRQSRYDHCCAAVIKMKTGIAALFAVLVAAELLNDAETQRTQCGYRRGVVRLEGGRYGREGRVEVCNNDWWGQLCENGWDDRDAAVVCRQLDLLSGDTVAIAVNGSYYGQGSGSTWLGNLGCSGTEATLVDCLTAEQQRSQWPELQCPSHAGILCLETDGGLSVRLIGGRSGREGRVEVFFGGVWGPVCGGTQWGAREAEIVCRELGLYDNGALSVDGHQFDGRRYGYTLVNGIRCFGNESRLALCRGGTWGRRWCSLGNAGVVCTQSGGCREGSVRLAGGETVRQGRVETCHGGIWGTVCKEDGIEWLHTDADIVCRQLGFQEQDERGARAVSSGEFGMANGVIWRFTVSCGHNFSRPCTPQNWLSTACNHSTDAAVTCPESKELLHLCADIEAQSLFTYGTLYAFYASVASRIVTQIVAGCSQPCSYSTRDISFESSWPSPIHPTTMCMSRDSILGVRLTCRYRPRLNENGRVQLAAYSILGSLGTTINCASYSRYVITKDFDLGDCTSRSRQPEIPQRTTLTGVKMTTNVSPTSSRALMKPTIPSSTGREPIVVLSATDTRLSVHLTSMSSQPPAVAQQSTQSSHPATLPPTSPTTTTTTNSPPIMMMVLMGLLAVSLVLLILSLLATLVLCVKRRSTKRRHLQSGADLSTSTHDAVQIHSTNPLAPVISHRQTSYYEDVDSHEYAVLEQTSQVDQNPRKTLSNTSAASTDHDYFFLDHSHKELVGPQLSRAERSREEEGDFDPEGLYSTLDHGGAEYATLEPEPQNETSVPDLPEYSQLTTGQGLHHDYQRVLPDPDSGYDRTFAGSLHQPCSGT